MISQFVFISPLWLIPAIISFIAIFLLNKKGSSKSSWWQLMDENIARSLIVKKGSHRFISPINLLLILVFLVCIALAGPAFKKQVPDELKDKASVIVLLANSDSMYSGDVTPNRNRLAKQKINTLVQKMQGSQFGLIAYANTAHEVSPLTSDPEFLKLYLNELEPELMPDREFRASGLEDGLNKALEMIKHAHYPVNLLIITDKIEQSNIENILVFQKDNACAVKVLAVGTKDGGALRFVDKKDVTSNVDTQMPLEPFIELKNQAIATLGVTQNDDDITWLRGEIIKSVADVNNKDPEFDWHNSGYILAWIFLPIALLLFRKQSFAAFAFVFLSACSMPGEEQMQVDQVSDVSVIEKIFFSADQLGQKAIDKKDYHKAALLFEDAYLKGWSLYQIKEYESAQEQFKKVKNADGYFYLANCLAQQERYKEALKYYGKSVEEKGIFEAAKYNIALIKEKMAKSNKVSANERKVKDEGRILLQVGSKAKANKKAQTMIDPLIYSEEELNLWLDKVESSPQKLLKTKFELQSQEKLIDES